MHFLAALAALPLALAAPVLQAPQGTESIANRWVAVLKSDADASALQSTLSSVAGILGAQPDAPFEIGNFKGFSLTGSNILVNLVSNLAHIDFIEPELKVSTLASQPTNLYGLARISHRAPGATSYDYNDQAGDGTYSYIIDTGIRTTHQDFGGRATFGANFAGDNLDTDGNGHGTHVAGTTGGSTYGVAKRTNLIAVKVLDSSGSGASSGVINGIAWAANDAKTKGRAGKAVANLSLGGIFSLATNRAAAAAVQQGLFLSVAAGNSGLPTFTSSPASEPSVCTVGAIDSTDTRASFSNFGALVDIFAPGVNITSAWKNSDTDTNTISGTSMATPHITGLGAYLLGVEGSRDPVALCQRIKDLATKGTVKNAGLFSPNAIAFNGFTA